jgi:hypothetical protein
MGKYEKRRFFRQYRRAGVPFILACKLARAKGGYIPASLFEPPEGYKTEVCVYCDCCGPEILKVSTLDGSRTWNLDYWSLLPV